MRKCAERSLVSGIVLHPKIQKQNPLSPSHVRNCTQMATGGADQFNQKLFGRSTRGRRDLGQVGGEGLPRCMGTLGCASENSPRQPTWRRAEIESLPFSGFRSTCTLRAIQAAPGRKLRSRRTTVGLLVTLSPTYDQQWRVRNAHLMVACNSAPCTAV